MRKSKAVKTLKTEMNTPVYTETNQSGEVRSALATLRKLTCEYNISETNSSTLKTNLKNLTNLNYIFAIVCQTLISHSNSSVSSAMDHMIKHFAFLNEGSRKAMKIISKRELKCRSSVAKNRLETS